MNNREFSGTTEFVKACELAKVKPTVRQASKYKSRRGSAYAFRKQVLEMLNPKEGEIK